MPHVTSDGSFQQISAGFFSIDQGRIKGFELRNKDASVEIVSSETQSFEELRALAVAKLRDLADKLERADI